MITFYGEYFQHLQTHLTERSRIVLQVPMVSIQVRQLPRVYYKYTELMSIMSAVGDALWAYR